MAEKAGAMRERPPAVRIWQIAELYPPDYGGAAAVYVGDYL